MKKKVLVTFLFAIVIGCLIGAAACSGDSSDGSYEWNCTTLILTADDFTENSEKLLSDDKNVVTSKASSLDCDTLTIGEEYYIVFAARGYTETYFGVEATITVECADIEFADDYVDYFTKEYYYRGRGSFASDVSEDTTTFSFHEYYYNETVSYYIAVGFKVNSESKLKITYVAGGVGSANLYNYTGHSGVYWNESISGYCEEQSKSVWAYYENQVIMKSLSVNYLSADDYNYGNFSESNLSSAVSLSAGEYAYIVIDFYVQSAYYADTDKITVNFTYSPYEYITGRIQEANTSNISETASDTEYVISAVYTLPENTGDERTERLIIRITAYKAEKVSLSVSFYCAEGVSVVGDSHYSYTIKIGEGTSDSGTAGLDFTPSSDKTSYIVTGADTSVTDVVIPATYGGLPVTAIESKAFSGCTSLTSIEIPDSVTSIGSKAFYGCTALTSIVIPDSVTTIGSGAFSGCSSLVSIVLPFSGASAEATSSSALFGYIFGTTDYSGSAQVTQYYTSSASKKYKIPSSLENVTINGGDVYYGAFYNCTMIKSITIGSGVTSIGDNAFYNCTALTEINYNATSADDLSSNKQTSSNHVFYNAGKNSDGIVVTIGANVKRIPANLFYSAYNSDSYAPNITSLVFENGGVCANIGNRAFYYLTSLTEVTIPDSVTYIGSSAFGYCSGLTSLTIGSGLHSAGSKAFYNCTALTEINYNATALADFSQSEDVFYNAGYAGGNGRITVNIAANVTKIPAYLFYRTAIAKVVFAEGSLCTSIGTAAFRECNLSSINIPDGVTYIGASAFWECNQLTSITLPSGISSIESYTFYGCYTLNNVVIPANVTYIGEEAFYGCAYLTSVTFENTSGWYVTETKGATSGITVTVTDSIQNANLFKVNYLRYYWYKE